MPYDSRPYISDGAKISPHADVHPSAAIGPNVIIEPDVYIGPFCIIGFRAESIKHWDKPVGKVVIKSGSIINGHVTIDAGTERDTIIGPDTFIMKHCHVGHDSQISKGVIMAPQSIVGGHCIIGENTNLGMGAIVHQRVNVPGGCMLGMGTVITKLTHMVPGMVYVGNPARRLKANNR